MANIKSAVILGTVPQPSPAEGGNYEIRQAVVTTALGVGQVFEMGFLPVDTVPSDWEVDCDVLDSNGTPLLTFDVGILNAAKTAVSTAVADGNGKWGTALTTGRAGGLVRAATVNHKRVVPNPTTPRTIGIVVVAAAATAAVTGVLGLTMRYRSHNQGV